MEALASSRPPRRSWLAWGVASRPAPGEIVCGDAHRLQQAGSAALLAVADGLGHGVEAREAALAALIQLYPDGLPNNKVTVVIWDRVNRRLRELGKRIVSLKTVEGALRGFPKSRV